VETAREPKRIGKTSHMIPGVLGIKTISPELREHENELRKMIPNLSFYPITRKRDVKFFLFFSTAAAKV